MPPRRSGGEVNQICRVCCCAATAVARWAAKHCLTLGKAGERFSKCVRVTYKYFNGLLLIGKRMNCLLFWAAWAVLVGVQFRGLSDVFSTESSRTRFDKGGKVIIMFWYKCAAHSYLFVGLVVKASVSRAANLGSISTFAVDRFPCRVKPLTY